MAYYLNYRSQKFDDLDLAEVRESLLNIVKSGSVPHAFLFSGPKGSGKTSAARILAKSLNCESTSKHLRGKKLEEPCNKCKACLAITNGSNIDVIEIDAASHRGIDDIRSLRDAVKLAPAGSKNKVYIIDEAHMLTTEASNALLKTLEEPPEHVYFVLATTNPEKLIDTIRSRATNIIFRKANDEEIVRALKRVVKGEKLEAEDEALMEVSKVSDGSFRDAVKTLEQLTTEKIKLTEDKVAKKLLQTKSIKVDEFIEKLKVRDSKQLLEMIEKAVSQGVGIETFLSNVINNLRNSLIYKVVEGTQGPNDYNVDQLIELMELFSDAYEKTGLGPIEQLPLEIAVIRWCEDGIELARDSIDEKEFVNEPKKKVIDIGINGAVEEKQKLEIRGEKIPDEIWKKILGEVRPKNAATEALLRASTPLGFDGESLTLGVYYSFHKERLEEKFHKGLLEEVLDSVLGKRVKVVCMLTEPPKKVEMDYNLPDRGINDSLAEDGQALTESEDEDIIKIAKEVFGD
jgi:DNA polymerase III subunit gamma/tau